MPLTDTAVRNAKPDPSRTLRIKDERGLYLEISPTGGKWWRLRYWISGKENRLSLGVYPDVSLKDARERRDDARRLIARGLDPSAVRKGQQLEAIDKATTFEKVAREWHAKFKPSWSPGHAASTLVSFERNAFPWIGARPVRDILPPEILAVARRVESRGAIETAHRLVSSISQVLRYAVSSGLADSDPTRDLRGALSPTTGRHHSSITDSAGVATLMRAIDGYTGSPVTRAALKLAPLTFVRPGELRRAEWSEFDLEKAEWRIPASKMKMSVQHVVPLSRQALAVIEELRPITGVGLYLFSSEPLGTKPMGENTVNNALRRMGYDKEQMTGHGFRSMASTLLNEQGWNKDAIERQLAHSERNGVRAAYNFADYLPERRKMMQAWADYLGALREERG